MTDMIQKNGVNFNKIYYPFTTIPVFSEFEAENLEQLWNLNIKNNVKIFSDDISHDSDFDSLEISRNIGVIPIETYNEIMVEPLYANHGKIIIPIINSILETLRIVNITCDSSKINNLISELSKGCIYNVVFLILTNVVDNNFTNLSIRILRNSILLLPQDIRINFKDIYYKPPQYLLSEFVTWVFILLSPQFIKDVLNNIILEKGSDIPSINKLIEANESPNKTNMDELRNIPPIALFFNLKIVEQEPKKIINKRITFKNKRQPILDKKNI